MILSVKVVKGLNTFENCSFDKICDRIRFAMCMSQISQFKLASDIGVSRDCIIDYTSSDYPEKSMQVETLKKMALYFEKDIYYFCNDYHKFLDSEQGNRILRQKRKELHLTQPEYAERLGVKIGIYKRYEQGRTRIPENIWKMII